MAAAPTITIAIDGAEERLTVEQARRRVVEFTREARSADDRVDDAMKARLDRYVRWGVVLIQVRPQIAESSFCEWLADAGCRHRQKAYSAIQVASELADDRGCLDEAKLIEKIRTYNRDCAKREGWKQLDERARSIRSTETALGLRPGVRSSGHANLPGSGGKEVSGAPDTAKLPRSGGSAMVVGGEDELAALMGLDAGEAASGEQTARAGTAAKVAAPVNRAATGMTGRSAGMGHDAQPVEGDTQRPLLPARGAGDAETGRGIPGKTRRGGDAIGQMSLAEEYANAAVIADRVAEMFRAGTLSAEFMRRFVELAGEAGVEGGA